MNSMSGAYVRMRGLPYSASQADIMEFFGDFRVSDVMICKNAEGRPSGDAFAKFDDESVARTAIQMRNKAEIGNRYIELYMASPEDVEGRMAGFGPSNMMSTMMGAYVKMRGLPYSATQADIFGFFGGFKVLEVIFCKNADGRASGDAFAKFEDESVARTAIQMRNKAEM